MRLSILFTSVLILTAAIVNSNSGASEEKAVLNRSGKLVLIDSRDRDLCRTVYGSLIQSSSTSVTRNGTPSMSFQDLCSHHQEAPWVIVAQIQESQFSPEMAKGSGGWFEAKKPDKWNPDYEAIEPWLAKRILNSSTVPTELALIRLSGRFPVKGISLLTIDFAMTGNDDGLSAQELLETAEVKSLARQAIHSAEPTYWPSAKNFLPFDTENIGVDISRTERGEIREEFGSYEPHDRQTTIHFKLNY